MSINMKQRLLLAKLQTALGAPATLAGANAILCRANDPEIITMDMIDRGLILPYKGNSGSVGSSPYRKQKIEVELAGSGAAGTAPAWGPLLQACGFSETITAGTSVVYAPITNAQKYISLATYLELLKVGTTDAYGTATFTLNSKSIPTLAMDFLGEYVAPADVGSLPSGVDYSNFIDPQAVGKVNTPTFTIHGVAGVLSDFSVNMASVLEYRDFVQGGGASSPDRKPTGTVVFELTTAAVKNWAETMRTGTTGALQLVHGIGAGNIIQFDMPRVKFTGLSITDKKGVAFLSAGLELDPVTGNDEITITVK